VSKSNRITYRFDRQGNKIEDTATIHSVVQQPSEPQAKINELGHNNELYGSSEGRSMETDSNSYNEYEIDIEKLERLIRESNEESSKDEEQQVEEQQVEERQVEVQQEKVPVQAKLTERLDQLRDYTRNDMTADIDATTIIRAENKNDDSNHYHYWKSNGDIRSTHGVNDDEQQRLYELDRADVEAIRYDRSSNEPSSYERSALFVEAEEHNIVKNKPLPWLSSAISVMSAIATGVCIGYLFLSLMFGISVWPLSALAQPSQAFNGGNAGPIDETQPVTQQREEKQIAPEAALQLSEASFNYQVLQAGVFTQEKTRDEVIASLEQVGFKAHYLKDNSNRYFVYAGVATSAANAAPIQGGIKGIETYRKEMTVNLPTQIAFKGEGEKLEQFFKDSNALIAMYADLVAAQLEQTSFSKIGQAAQESWEAAYKDWLALAEQIDTNWVEASDKEQASALKEQLMNAEKQMQSYQTEPKSTYLWNAQSSLVKSVLIQKEWFE